MCCRQKRDWIEGSTGAASGHVNIKADPKLNPNLNHEQLVFRDGEG